MLLILLCMENYIVVKEIIFLSQTRKGFGKVEASMRVEDGLFIVEKGSICAPVTADWVPEVRKTAVIKDNILQEEVECNSPSTAGWIAMGKATNGWEVWKSKDGRPLDIYRKK